MQGSLYPESAYFYNWSIYIHQVIISLFWKVFQIRPSLSVADSARVVTFVAEFAVAVVAADDDIVPVIIFLILSFHLQHFYLMVFCGFTSF